MTPFSTFTYGYSGAGRQVQNLTLPGNSQISRVWDDAGQMLQTTLNAHATVLDGYQYTYDANGNRLSVTRPNNAYVNYGYDDIGQLVSAVGFEPNGVTPRANEDFGYGYDAAGNLLQRTNNTLIQAFTTDNANELLNVSRNNDVLTIEGNVTNLPSALRINGQAATIYNDKTFALTNSVALNNGLNVFTTVITSAGLTMTNLLNKTLPTSQNLGYDLNGNLTSDGLHGYDYDCANELIRVTQTNQWKVEYTYDGFGRRRIRKEYAWQGSQWLNASEVHYIYDGMQVLQERTVLNTPSATYTRGLDLSGTTGGAGGIGGLLARTDNNGNSAYYHTDGNGNVTMLVDGSGNMLAKYLYDSFGNTLGMWGTLATVNTYRFSSKEVDLRTGQYYYGFRYYEPNLQRWLNQDPIGERGGINLYGFVGNNPVNRVDPFGLQPPGIGAWGFPGMPTTVQGAQALSQQQNIPPQVSAQQVLNNLPPPLNSSFSFGVSGTANLEYGFVWGAGGTFSGGIGIFYNPKDGPSLGTFLSTGGFFGGPGASFNYPHDPCHKSGADGAYAGFGGGPWISNAGASDQLMGPFNQANFNSPLSLSYADSDGIWIYTASGGYGRGASFSAYPTSTFSTASLNLLDGNLTSH